MKHPSMETTNKKLLLSLFFFFSFIVSSTISQVEFALFSCSLSGNFTNNSNYKRNLDNLLSSASSNKQLLKNGFYSFSSGQEPDKVNAIALCRGDVSVEICRTCVDDATRKILEVCPNQKEAIVWYNQCLFRYSNKPIFGVMNNLAPQFIFNGNSASDSQGFLQALKPLLNRLKNEAASGDSTVKFAAGKNSAPNDTVYGLLQCTPDLSSKDCNGCLGLLVALISEARLGARIFTASCTLRYETNQFYTSPSK